jgi:hypothetical protein
MRAGVAPSALDNELATDPANVFIQPAAGGEDDVNKRTNTQNVGAIDFSNLANLIDMKNLTNIFNSYSTNKSIANGFFNISLLSSNFAQMKAILSPPGNKTQTWPPLAITSIVFVCVSLLLQFLLAFMLVFLAKNGEFLDDNRRNTLIRNNNLATIVVFFITILNICINVFISI